MDIESYLASSLIAATNNITCANMEAVFTLTDMPFKSA